ncbi:TPA: hypothetical protein ACX6SY_003206 [Photobacterium damselae]
MKEIGGYFGLEQLINKPYHENAIRLNSGRSALAYLIKVKKIKKIYLPLFLCNTVKDYISKFNIKIKFYHIDNTFKVITNNIVLDDNSYLYVVNYYGQLPLEYLKELNCKYKRIIVDNTHDFFNKHILDVDTIYSCRKFFGVPDGAYLYTNKISDEVLNDNKIVNKLKHIVGRSEFDASSYYSDYVKNDSSFETSPILNMSQYTQIILGAIDYELVAKKRNQNYLYLHQYLSSSNELNVTHYNAPYCYPLMVKNSKKIREKLIKNRIYIPVLWGDSLTSLNAKSIEVKFVKNILPIPCDQRYNIIDMEKIINIIKGEL